MNEQEESYCLKLSLPYWSFPPLFVKVQNSVTGQSVCTQSSCVAYFMLNAIKFGF